MRSRLLVFWLSAALSSACLGKIDSAGSDDGGPHANNAVGLMQETGATPNDSGQVVRGAAGTINAPLDAPSGVDAPSGTETLIELEGGVGGLCSGGDPGNPSDASADISCGCTRRPGAGNSFQCPAGVGESTTATIGPSGGTVSLEGRQGTASGVQAQLRFPPTAIPTPAQITLVETTIPPPVELIDWSPVYLAEPPALVLASRTPVQFPWSNLSGAVPDLAIWFSPDGACFTRVSDSYTNAGFEQGSITQLGYFVVGMPRTASTATCP